MNSQCSSSTRMCSTSKSRHNSSLSKEPPNSWNKRNNNKSISSRVWNTRLNKNLLSLNNNKKQLWPRRRTRQRNKGQRSKRKLRNKLFQLRRLSLQKKTKMRKRSLRENNFKKNRINSPKCKSRSSPLCLNCRLKNQQTKLLKILLTTQPNQTWKS